MHKSHKAQNARTYPFWTMKIMKGGRGRSAGQTDGPFRSRPSVALVGEMAAYPRTSGVPGGSTPSGVQ